MLIPSSKQWRRDHPFAFYAKPARTKEGVLDLKNWECGIPGKEKTIWEGGIFKLTISFPDGEFFRSANLLHDDADFILRIPYKAPKV